MRCIPAGFLVVMVLAACSSGGGADDPGTAGDLPGEVAVDATGDPAGDAEAVGPDAVEPAGWCAPDGTVEVAMGP